MIKRAWHRVIATNNNNNMYVSFIVKMPHPRTVKSPRVCNESQSVTNIKVSKLLAAANRRNDDHRAFLRRSKVGQHCIRCQATDLSLKLFYATNLDSFTKRFFQPVALCVIRRDDPNILLI